jgi:PPOX class probable F420-dependent enzyme
VSKLTTPAAKLFSDPNYAQLAVIRPDGTPHVSPVWVHTDGERVQFNTAEGRAKHRYLLRDPRATIHVSNNQDPYEWVSVTGAVEITSEGADDDIDALAKKYLGVDAYPARRPDEVRLKVVLTPDRIEYVSPR